MVNMELLPAPHWICRDCSNCTAAPLFLLPLPTIRLPKCKVSVFNISSINHYLFPLSPLLSSASAWVGKKLGQILGIRYKMIGIENLRKSGGVLLINHQSFLDLIILAHLWLHLGPAAVIAKKEIMYLPPIGISIWSYGSIFIDRSNKKAARQSMERASRAINSEGKKLIIFPEGTRSVSDQLLPFRNGAFISAFDNKCNIYPVVVSKFSVLDHTKKFFKPGTGLISILEPVESTDFKEFGELRDHCQEIMQKEYDRVNSLIRESEKLIK